MQLLFDIFRIPHVLSSTLLHGSFFRHGLTNTDFLDLFGKQKSLAQETFYSPFQLIDLNTIPDEELRKHQWAGLLELFLKHARLGDMKNLIDQTKNFFHELIRYDHAEKYLHSMLYYWAHWTDESPKELFDYVRTQLPKPLEGNMKKSIAQYFREEGEESGMRRP